MGKGSFLKNTSAALQFKATTDDVFLIVSIEDRIQQINHQRDGDLIVPVDNLTNTAFPNLFYDNARLVGFFKPNNILIYRVDNAGKNTSNVNYSLRLS